MNVGNHAAGVQRALVSFTGAWALHAEATVKLHAVASGAEDLLRHGASQAEAVRRPELHVIMRFAETHRNIGEVRDRLLTAIAGFEDALAGATSVEDLALHAELRRLREVATDTRLPDAPPAQGLIGRARRLVERAPVAHDEVVQVLNGAVELAGRGTGVGRSHEGQPIARTLKGTGVLATRIAAHAHRLDEEAWNLQHRLVEAIERAGEMNQREIAFEEMLVASKVARAQQAAIDHEHNVRAVMALGAHARQIDPGWEPVRGALELPPASVDAVAALDPVVVDA